ncbi:hypothetical protein D3C71_1636860 [compost metagenome]
MLRAGGEHQQQLGLGRERLGGDLRIRREHQRADALGQGGAAGFAGQHHLMPARLQGLADRVDGGGLAGALAPFQADEMRVPVQRGTHWGAASLVRLLRSCCR